MTTGGNEWQGQLNVVLQIPGVGSGAMPGGGGGQLNSPAINDMANHLRRISGDTARQGSTFDRSLAKVGIKFNLAAILKQSQIFTSTLGSLFQIFGAVADIILAAFMPILIPAIRWVASSLPEIKDVIQKTVGNFVEYLLIFKDKVGDISKFTQQTASNVLQTMGLNKEMADSLTSMDKEGAFLTGGAALAGAGTALGGRPGGGFASKWGGRMVAGVGITEFIEWMNSGFDKGQAPEGALGGLSGIAAFGGGKTKGIGIAAGIASQIIEQLRIGLNVGDEPTLKLDINGVEQDVEKNVVQRVEGLFNDALEMTVGWFDGEGNNR